MALKDITSQMRSPSKEDVALITKAYAFAEKAHEGVKRYSGDPFFSHLEETAKKLAELGMGGKTIAAGLLHDSIEDTEVNAKDIEKEFGKEILSLVEGVTKLGSLKYHGLQRHTESLRKLFVAIAQDIRVLIIKLADRLHNMKTLEHVPTAKQRRIADETLEIYAPLAYRLGMRALSRELEDLAFPFVYPDKHEETLQLRRQKKKETEKHLEKMHKSLKKELGLGGLRTARTDFRLKGLYSLYKKLERKGMDINKIYDISALRIIVPTLQDCYTALGIVHSIWRPLPGRIKDYIAFPKPNGYQSIHTTVFTGDGAIIEIQIRSEEMHRDAEFGIAAHFIYKETNAKHASTSHLAWIANLLSYRAWFQRAGDGVVPPDTSSPMWLKQLAEDDTIPQDPKEFLEHIKGDFFKHRVFAFTPKGEVIDLPIGASPIDFAYAVHTEIGNHTHGARVNGKLVALDTELKNGDIVDILTKESSKPSHKWLEFAKTGLAKSKIRGALGGK